MPCHLPSSSNTEKVPIWAILIFIMTIATLSNVQHMIELQEYETLHISSAVLYLIPTIVIAVLNVAIFRQLKRLLKTDQFASATNEIKRVLFQVGLTNLIAIIFVGSQVAYAISVCLHIVSSFAFEFYLCLLRFIAFFQYLLENQENFEENPLEWKTLYKFYSYIEPIMILCRLLNSCLDFYAYMFMRYRNKRAETRRRQEQQQDREMKTQKTIETNLETA